MNIRNIILLIIIMMFSGISSADVLLIDRVQLSKSVDTPPRGMTMNQVESQFGEPELKKNPVGKPPITIWKYKKYSVYFEHKWVIKSVVKKAKTDEKGPKKAN